MRVYQLASALIPDGFQDAKVLRDEPITREIAGQLYAAVTSIEASIERARLVSTPHSARRFL